MEYLLNNAKSDKGIMSTALLVAAGQEYSSCIKTSDLHKL